MKLTSQTGYQTASIQAQPGKSPLSQNVQGPQTETCKNADNTTLAEHNSQPDTQTSRSPAYSRQQNGIQNDKNIPEYLKPPSQREQKSYSSFSTQEPSSLQKAFERANAKKSYDGTSDLMAIANAENEASLRSICVMLSYKLRHLKYSGSDSNSVKGSARKIKKVMGKARSKIRKLQKEAEMEKKAEIAKKARQRRLQMEIRRELSLRRKVRKAKERKDVADSYMESQMEQASQQNTAPVVPDAVFTDLGSTTSASIDIISQDVSLTDAAVTAVAEAGGVTADIGGMGGSIDLSL